MNESTRQVLIVDDEAMNRELLDLLLTREGYRVLQAANATSALELIERERIDLVLMDVSMPGIDGIEAGRRMRASPRGASIPLVYVTALHDRDTRIRAKEVGADDFLTKPVDEVELTVRARNLLAAKAARELQEQYRDELEREVTLAREQALKVERLATLGTLAAGVGHELNNVAAVLRSLYGAIAESSASPLTAEDLRDLKSAIDHVTTHGRHLLSLGRPDRDKLERIDVRDIIENTLSMLRTAGRIKRLDVTSSLPQHPLRIIQSRVRLEQVLVNLLSNAADALEDAPPPRRLHVSLEPALDMTRAIIKVEDSAGGIPPQVLERIFDAYFTTKAPGRGTGLGLPVVKRIVEQGGGNLRIDTQVGLGTTVTVELPIEPPATAL